MTSFFTIELDAFPYNDEGKMPLPTILGIIRKEFAPTLAMGINLTKQVQSPYRQAFPFPSFSLPLISNKSSNGLFWYIRGQEQQVLL